MNWTGAATATFWGLVAAAALPIGAAIGLYGQLSYRMVASIMAFGAGILISAVAFDIMDDAFVSAGFIPSAGGFLLGAVIFTVGSLMLARAGGRHRMRSRPIDGGRRDSATAIALGTIIDSIPESFAIGLSVATGGTVAGAVVIAVFLSNIPEALSSSAGMKAGGRRTSAIFGLWIAVAGLGGLCALAGYVAMSQAPPEVAAFVQAIAGGALIALIADTMIPEAFAETHDAAGLITALGFLAGFGVSHGLG